MKKFLLYLFFISAAFTASAQPPGDGQGKIEALYIAYVQQQLNFTPGEAQRFWPIHELYKEEVKAINRANLNELDRQQRMLDVKRKYQPQFAGVIGLERANRFFTVSDRFIDRITGRFKEMRQERKAETEEIRPNGGGMRPPGYRNGGGIKRDREPIRLN